MNKENMNMNVNMNVNCKNNLLILLLPVFLLLLPLLGVGAVGAGETEPGPWESLSVLEGKWEALAPGVSRVEQEYRFLFGKKFLHGSTRAVFEPTEKNPKGEIHEDIEIFSWDSARKTVIIRGFYSEGFVNRYVLEPVVPGSKEFIFVSEAVENAPPGTRAKLIFKFMKPGEMEQRFFVAWPGKEYHCYFTHHFKKKS